MIKFRKTALNVVSIGLAACFSTSIAAMAVANTKNWEQASAVKGDAVTRLDASVDNHTTDYFDKNVAYRLSDNISDNQEISVILSLATKSAFDEYLASGNQGEFADYLSTASAKSLAKKNKAERDELKKTLDKAKISYKMGVGYDAVVNGFEVILRAKDYYKLADAVEGKASLIVGEVYAPAESLIVTNDVDVYETGIFDSSSIEHQGDGVVVAVLDTGLDYTHTAFSVDNFSGDPALDAFDLSYVTEKVNDTDTPLSAKSTTSGLTGEDVYINRKVPYAYDYADRDADVFPLDSEHGTHVAGVIAGKDSEITGVAPNAQLAIMKVFSDSTSGARTSWLLAALDDCVKLGVDVINMSLGSGAGFTTQDDDERIETIYNRVRAAGISLITAAGNDDTAVAGSSKNGSNPLTSNPDSGVVGSPSTYQAALSVASVGGVKTPYFLYNGDIMYFTEASTSSAKTKSFVDDILKTVGGADSYDFDYVTISGVGRRSDYHESKDYYKNKIVLVKRGETTFEEKVDVALRVMGAAGIVIYNNVSGTISMSVGADIGAVCSISQDEGEKLAAARTGVIRISRSQVAGPFMSDFSSWGPTSDLKIKPEITAHGGEIYSAVPGQSYDRLSGTSMASPNMAGAAALIRQYVKFSEDVFGQLKPVEVTKRVNQLAMSTADIVRNKNGLVYSVRKQGAGLVNIKKATTAAAYISTYEKDNAGNLVEMDKSKLELGDDKNRTGVYTMSFDINNVTGSLVSYDIGSIVMTEGVSTTYTSHGDTTVSKDGYLLSPATSIESVTGGTRNGSVVTVPANGSAKVTVKITLSDADKAYMDDSFQYGMYVEGYITMKAVSGTSVDLNVPMLAFYGDWTEAPIFDEEYYDTNPDEVNAGIDPEDKIMEDAYATRIYGGYYSDYITTLGTYPFVQNPAATQIAANKEHIALSNYEDGNASAVNKINSIAAGLLRNVKEWELEIVEDSTGKVVWEKKNTKDNRNQRKSISQGSTVYQSSMDVDFSVLENNLKNNTKYTVTVKTYIDYGEFSEQNNVRNTFSFPLYIDFEAPIVTGVEYRTEYDQSTRKTRLFADVNIYDNHYAMAVQFGQIVESTTPGYRFSMNSFGKYMTPVFSSYNSTSMVTFELTDYVELIKNSAGIKYNPETGATEMVYNNNSFTATCYDYAMNAATYELQLPDEVIAMYFTEEEIALNPNETLDLTTVLNVFPAETWLQVLDFRSSNDSIVGVVNQTAIAKEAGEGKSAIIYATGKDANGREITKSITIRVREEGEDGYRKYDPPQVNRATISQYHTVRAFYSTTSADRGVGVTGGTYDFGTEYYLSMYPAESIELISEVDTYFPEYTPQLRYSSTRPEIVSVDANGRVTALARGNATINVNVDVTYPNNRTTSFFVGAVDINVKDPFTTNSIYLTSYKGLGGEVEIPKDRGVTTIQSFAFSNYEFVDKDLSAGDVIDDEDPYYIKQWYIGDDTITKVIIPEGVEVIESYAFANLTALEEVVFPSTLIRIGVGAFYGCTKLKKVNFENVKFINERAFYNCKISQPDFRSVVAIGSDAFANNEIGTLNLPASAQSLDSGAFAGNTSLNSVTFNAAQIKIGASVFSGCTNLLRININAAVIPAGAFFGCTNLREVTLGRDVAVIGEEAFGATSVASFTIHPRNANLETRNDGKLIYDKSGKLVMAAPQYGTSALVLDSETTSVASGAFAGNASIQTVYGPNVTTVEDYAFADCMNLTQIDFPELEVIGDYAFYNARNLKIKSNDTENQLAKIKSIGNSAFFRTAVTEVTVPDGSAGEGVTIGERAFAYCFDLASVKIGNNAVIGAFAFFNPVSDRTYEATQSMTYYTQYDYKVGDTTYSYYRYNFAAGVLSNLTSLTIGANVTIGDYAFRNCARLESVTLGDNAKIGAYAFHDANALKSIDLSKVASIGEGAFSGTRHQDYWLYRNYYRPAYEFEVIDGELTAVGYRYSDFAASFATADLSNATSVGLGAFAFNQSLTTVILNASLKEIADLAFAQCSNLATVKVAGQDGAVNLLPETVTRIGESAFANTKITNLALENVAEIGSNAFRNTPLTEATLKDGVAVGDYAFYNAESLAVVNNMKNAVSIGERAFAHTALKEADLTNVKTLGDFAFGESEVTEVVFGNALTDIGENPFYNCKIASFARTEDIMFNGQKVGERVVDTYDISDSVKVIGNVLYAVVPNGLELICYPIGAKTETFTVEEGTVRIGARAFQGAQLVNVTLPSTLKALGDKAFYECASLTTVIFKSYRAPVLEEEYDPYYLTEENLPMSGNLGGFEGLGISDYYMWNASSPNNYYFGANFVNNIGKFTPSLVMVSPANGTGYNTFIFEKYFNTFVLGSNAATDNTLQVIALIAALNSSITLDDEEAVAAARRAYEALPNLEQKALVSNYTKLTSAENTIEYLKQNNKPNVDPPKPDDPAGAVNALGIAGFTIAGLLLLALAGLAAYMFLEKKKAKEAAAHANELDSTETVGESGGEAEDSGSDENGSDTDSKE